MKTNAKDTVTEPREVEPFDRINLRGYGRLIVTQGEEVGLTVEARETILPHIVTEVKDGELVIRMERGWWEGLIATLRNPRVVYRATVRELTALRIPGAGRVQVSDIEAERLTLRLPGAGDVEVTGLTAEELDVELPGTGNLRLTGRVAQQRATLGGAGNATVRVSETLDARISGVGHIAYYGDPEVTSKVTGLGSIQRAEEAAS
ncbi:MAG: head GIN domain-containing protein [Chloroflexota bacterium]|nr:head GIN domain-containing protein [Chloroflexota bacterium]